MSHAQIRVLKNKVDLILQTFELKLSPKIEVNKFVNRGTDGVTLLLFQSDGME